MASATPNFALERTRFARPLTAAFGCEGKVVRILAFLAFLTATHFGVVQVFRLTTYHRYFWRASPLLVVYAALVGWRDR